MVGDAKKALGRKGDKEQSQNGKQFNELSSECLELTNEFSSFTDEFYIGMTDGMENAEVQLLMESFIKSKDWSKLSLKTLKRWNQS